MDETQFIIDWNEKFPLDKWWRDKYKIPFNSKQHREISYYDIFLEWFEENVYNNYINNMIEKEQLQESYKKEGTWFKDIVDEQKETELIEKFDNIDFSAFDNM